MGEPSEEFAYDPENDLYRFADGELSLLNREYPN